MSAPRRPAKVPAKVPAQRPGAAPVSAPKAPASRWLRATAAVVAVEGAGLVVVSLAYGVSVRDQGHGLSAWGAALVGVAVGVLLVAGLARSLARSSRGAVAPTVLLQLICAGEAYNMSIEHQWASATVVGVLALTALVGTVVGLRQLGPDDDLD